jgi:hypothetical protein
MYINKLSIQIKVLLALYFFLGIAIFDDYGISVDEIINRRNGLIALKIILDKFNLITDIFVNLNIKVNSLILESSNYDGANLLYDKYYGTIIELPISLIEVILRFYNEDINFYYLRHLINFFIFFLSVIYTLKTVGFFFNSQLYQLIVFLILILSPRFFAESFYNSKDIIFFSLFSIVIYFFLKFLSKPNFKNLIVYSALNAICIDLRIMGIIFLFYTPFFYFILCIKNKNFNKFIVIMLTYFFFTFLFIYIFWPFLWEDPLNRLYDALRVFDRFPWGGKNFYLGNYVFSDLRELPWHYLPLWMLITTPVIYTILFIFGSINFLLILKNSKANIFNLNKLDILKFIIFCLFFGPIVAVIIIKSSMYDGWRQMYFVYSPFIIICIFGLDFLIKTVKNKLIFFSFIFGLFINFIYLGSWIYMNHPFQYLYFNFFTLNKWNLNFEMDYSGVSFKQGVKYILSIDSRDKINVNIDTLYAYKAYHSLNSNEKKKILINDSGFPYDYIIINYRYKQDKSDYFYLEQSIELKKRGYIKIYDFKVDKNVFLSIFSN